VIGSGGNLTAGNAAVVGGGTLGRAASGGEAPSGGAGVSSGGKAAGGAPASGGEIGGGGAPGGAAGVRGTAITPVACGAPRLAAAVTNVTLNGDDINTRNINGLTFKGFGVLSANGTSELLMDYKSEHPESYAEQRESAEELERDDRIVQPGKPNFSKYATVPGTI
jgi:hypothetical protein